MKKILLLLGGLVVLVLLVGGGMLFGNAELRQKLMVPGGMQSLVTREQCPEPFVFTSPVDLAQVTSLLYPGQVRGGDYKPHGGFRFDNSVDGMVTVRAPADAKIFQASRYIEVGEVQYMFDFRHACGIVYRFDHLKTLSPKLQAIADTLPEAKPDDSRTTSIHPSVAIKTGDILATQVGVTGNTFVDWGVYDYRQHNGVTKPNKALASFGVCWFDWLPREDQVTIQALRAVDSPDNSQSDYCQ